MITAGSAIAYLDLDASKFKAGLRSSMNDFKSFLDETRSSEQRLRSLSNSFGTLGASMTRAFTVPLVGAGGAALKFFSDFEKGIKKISTLDTDNILDMEKLKNDALSLSSEYGIAVEQINEATYQMGSALGEVTDDMIEHVETAVKLSVGGFTDAATAVDGMTTAMNVYGDKSKEFGKHISDVLLTSQNLGKTTAGEIANSWGEVLPLANQLGLSVDEVGAAYVQLTKNGLATTKATTGLKAAFTNIIKPSQEAKEAASALGMEFSAAALQQKGFAGFMQEVKNGVSQAIPAYGRLIDQYSQTASAMRQLEEAGQKGSTAYKQQKEHLKELKKQMETLAESGDSSLSMYGQMFGSVEALNAMLLLLADGGIEAYNKAVDKMADSTGATEEAVEKMLNTVQTDWNKTINQAKNTLIKFGNIIAPTFSKGLVAINKLITTIDKLPPEAKKLIVTTGLFVAAMGPALLVGKKAINGFLFAKGAIAGVIPFMKNAGLAVHFLRGGMVPLTGQAMTLTKIFGFMSNPLGVAIVLFGSIFLKSKDLRTEFGRLIKNIFALGGSFVNGLYKVVKPVFDFIGKAFEWLGNKLAWLIGKINNQLEKIKPVEISMETSDLVNQAKETRDVLAGLLEDAGEEAGESAVEGFKETMPEFNEVGEELGESVSDGIRDGLEESKRHFEKLADDLERQLDKNKDELNRFGDAIVEALKRKYDKDKDAFSKAMEEKTDKARKESDKIKDALQSAHEEAMRALEEGAAPELRELQNQIDLINKQQDTEDKAEEGRQHRNRVHEIEFKIQNAKTEKERTLAERELAELQNDWNRKQLREQRRAQVEQIRQQMDAIRQSIEQKKKEAEEKLRLDMEAEDQRLKIKMKTLDEEKRVYEEHYAKMTDSYALSEEARKLVVEGKNKEILELLQTFYPEWQNVGQSFSEKLTEGLNSGKESMEQAISSMLNLQRVIPEQERHLRSYRNRISELDRQLQSLKSTTNSAVKALSSMPRSLTVPKVISTPVQVNYSPVYTPYNPYNSMVRTPQFNQQSIKKAVQTYKPYNIPKSQYPSGGGARGETWKERKMYSHADGLRNVPYDGYMAMLHRNEAVLTAKDNDRLKMLERLLESSKQTNIPKSSNNNWNISVKIDSLAVGTTEADRKTVIAEITREIQRSKRSLGVR